MSFRLILLRIVLCISIQSALALDGSSSEQNYDFPDACEIEGQLGNWKDCANGLSTYIWNTNTWYDDQPIQICDIKCSRIIKGHVSSQFQWVWDARFQCDDKVPDFIGKARGFKTRREAMQSAMAQTIEQGLKTNQLTLNDFKC